MEPAVPGRPAPSVDWNADVAALPALCSSVTADLVGPFPPGTPVAGTGPAPMTQAAIPTPATVAAASSRAMVRERMGRRFVGSSGRYSGCGGRTSTSAGLGCARNRPSCRVRRACFRRQAAARTDDRRWFICEGIWTGKRVAGRGFSTRPDTRIPETDRSTGTHPPSTGSSSYQGSPFRKPHPSNCGYPAIRSTTRQGWFRRSIPRWFTRMAQPPVVDRSPWVSARDLRPCRHRSGSIR